MQFLDSVANKARSSQKSIVLAEGEDARVLKAAQRAQRDEIANCVVIGNENTIRERAASLEIDLAGISIEDPQSSQYHQRYSDTLFQLRRHKGMTERKLASMDPIRRTQVRNPADRDMVSPSAALTATS